ncbi:MAG: M20/M25/M40 family metallo-hydrolase [bacterium]|nr:M20/M25/M40 family metallo-hydrolase [bacterium]
MNDPIELTKQLVAINSVNPFLTITNNNRQIGIGSESIINEFIEDQLKSLGFDVERQIIEEERTLQIADREIHIPARWNILAEKGKAKESILFYGHSDTVDVKNGWKTDPFIISENIVEDRSRLYGLGANDMKSGLAAIICGAGSTLSKNLKIKIAILVDEEFWSFGATKLCESNFLKDVKLAIAPEIGEGGNDPDIQWLGLGRLGRSEFEFEVIGKSCHGADAFIDETAINAVHEAIKIEAAIVNYCESTKKEFINDGMKALNSAYINSHSGGRAMLSLPDKACFILDRTYLPGEDPNSTLAELKELLIQLKTDGEIYPRTAASVKERSRPTPSCKPYYFSSETPAIKSVLKIVKNLSPKYELGIGRSVADENRIAELGIPTLVLGPHGRGSHTSNEWVDKESIKKVSKIFQAIAQDFSLT